MNEIKIGGKYKHHKGNLYKVIGLARHSETLEEMVIYECLYDNPRGKIWVRPKNMFLEIIIIEGKEMPRFEFIS